MFEPLISVLDAHFEGKDMKRGDALKSADAIRDLNARLSRSEKERRRLSTLHTLDEYNQGFLRGELKKAHEENSELKEQLARLAERDTPLPCCVKVTYRGEDVSGETDEDCDLTCPKCGAVVGDAEYNELVGPFCHSCGQALALSITGAVLNF